MSSNITNFKNIINQNFAAAKRKITIIENNYNASSNSTTGNNQVVNRNIGEIIYSSLPLTDAGLHLLDGSLIHGGGIYSDFVDYIANIYKTKDRVYNSSAFTVAGSPIITNDGIASGFSASNKISFISPNLGSVNSWSIHTKFNTGDLTLLPEWPNKNIFGGNFSYQWVVMNCAKINNKYYIGAALGNSTGTGWQITQGNFYGKTEISSNTEYYAILDFTGNSYNLYLSTDGITYNLEATHNSTEKIYSSDNLSVYIGANRYGTADLFTGSIDLKQFSIAVDGVEVFNGSTPANYFIDETEWQQSVTQYGVCGKFVYDSTLNTVRLPKITGILEGTTDATALGDLVEAGLPNITGNTTFRSTSRDASGAFYVSSAVGSGYAGTGGNAEGLFGYALDASRSSLIYGNSSTVQPQTIKCFVYIVIANSTKTDIQVDIDEIATDLNGKADVDLSNTIPTASFATALNNAGIRTVVETYVNGTSWYRVYSDGWCEQGGRCESSGASYGQTTLLKPYKNTNYIVLFSFNTTLGCRDDMFSVSYVQAYNKTASSFYSYRADSNSNLATMWRACGYV